MKYSATFAALLALIPVAIAQSPVWGQCGGQGWTGPTSCAAGSTCVLSNPWYSQCIPGAAPSQPAQPPPPSSTSSATSPAPTQPTNGSGLNALFKSAGKLYFGTATDTNEFNDAAYMAVLNNANEFGQLTPANSMKWDTTEPQRGTFQFAKGDQIVSQAKKNGQIMRGHNCVWYNQLPSWVSSGSWSASTLTSVMQNHCSSVVSHYKGQIYSWDVVNEPFNDDGTWRTDVFYNVIGTNYVSLALQAARAADPNAKLYINDYNIEYSGPKLTAMLNLVKQLKAANVPLDGIGLQGHFISGSVPGNIASVLQQFTALGVEVAITELDIRMTLPSNDQKLQQQKTDYTNVVRACAQVEGCVGITIWDFSDKYSWVPQTFGGQGAACPWDENMKKKPAYDGIVAGI